MTMLETAAIFAVTAALATMARHVLTDGPTLIAMFAGGICAGWLFAAVNDARARRQIAADVRRLTRRMMHL